MTKETAELLDFAIGARDALNALKNLSRGVTDSVYRDALRFQGAAWLDFANAASRPGAMIATLTRLAALEDLANDVINAHAEGREFESCSAILGRLARVASKALTAPASDDRQGENDECSE